MKPAAILRCEKGRHVSGFNAKGECLKCRARARAARRRVKAASLGTPLVRYGAVLKIADDLWSVWVRAAADACVVCGKPFAPEAMQCMHGFSRKLHATRFEPMNTFAGCLACHFRNTPPGPSWWRWMLAYLGEGRCLKVERQSEQRFKYSASDLQLVIIDAQQRIAALPDGTRKEWALERQEAILGRLVRVGAAA